MFGRKKKVEVVMHRSGATVYRDGRYLVVDARMSTRSKKGRDALKDLADAILAEAREPVRDVYGPKTKNDLSTTHQNPKE